MKILVSLFLVMLNLCFAAENPSLTANDELFSALLGKDQKIVEARAGALAASLEKMKAPGLEEGLKALRKISAKNDKEENVEAYAKFMEVYLPFAKKQGLDADHQVYYCPMVKKYWIQNGKQHGDVRNVFAQYMLECGEKVKT